MNAVVPIRPENLFTPAQTALIRRTVARDTNNDEFDLFIAVARSKGLDPFSKQIHCVVFNKDKPDKRNMSIIVGIDGMRSVAARSGRYRPDEDEPVYTYDEALKGPLNPLGLVKATTRIWIADPTLPGDWKPATGVAYWEEFAPIKDEWAENDAGRWKPTGKQTLDTAGNWGKMPRVMLAKCAEAQALRKAFPEDLSGVYEGAELDRARIIDLTASEVVEVHDRDERLKLIGGASGITFQLSPTSPLENIRLGEIADRVLAAVREFDLNQLRWFESANKNSLNEFWARAKADALGVKQEIKRRGEQLLAEQGAA